MDISLQFQTLAVALGLGLLVGLQREHAAARLAGVRTFPLVTLLGSVCALLAGTFGGWVVAAGFVAIAAVVVVGHAASRHADDARVGVTTEVAMLAMYAIGAYLVVGLREVGVALGAGVAVLLHFKERLHGFASKISNDDLRSIMQFALLSLVILPALPNRELGPYGVLNPHRIWLMVVLIVGINLGGYVAYTLFGDRVGLALSGVFGGLISSTATTVGYSRKARTNPETGRRAAVIVTIASAVVFGRLLLEVYVVAPSSAVELAPRLAAMLVAFAALSVVAWLGGRGGEAEPLDRENPSELKSALVFGLLYAGVLLAVAAAKARFGAAGLYAVAAVSGLTDVDAITLSTAALVDADALDAADGSRVILVAALSNLAFKTLVVVALGGRVFAARVVPLFAVAIAAGLLFLFVL